MTTRPSLPGSIGAIASSSNASTGRPARRGLPARIGREFLLEPRHQPETAIDLDLVVVGPRDCRRIGRQEPLDLAITLAAGIHRGRGAERDTSRFGRNGAGAEHLAGLVRPGGIQHQPRSDAHRLRGRRMQRRQRLARFDQLRHLPRFERQGSPTPVAGRRPAPLPVIERQITHLGADGIAPGAGHAVHEKARQQGRMRDPGVCLGRGIGEPVRRRAPSQTIEHRARACRRRGQRHRPRQRWHVRRATTIKPGNGGPDGLVVGVDEHAGGALRGQCHAGDAHGQPGLVVPERAAGCRQRIPEHLGILLGECRLRYVVRRVDRALGASADPPRTIECQRPYALGADIDGQNAIAPGHAAPPGRHRRMQRLPDLFVALAFVAPASGAPAQQIATPGLDACEFGAPALGQQQAEPRPPQHQVIQMLDRFADERAAQIGDPVFGRPESIPEPVAARRVRRLPRV